MKHWTRLADADGVRQKHQTTHEFRDLRIFENFDGGFTLRGSFGALRGATIRELYDRFVTAERLADWDQARNIHGDRTNQSHLARTEAQRRADAFEAAPLQGSGTMPDSNLPEPSMNIAMSPDMFEQGLATLTDTPTAPLDPKNYRNIRCETFGGTQLDPADAVAAAIKGHIRRIVYTTPEASISQKGRFFTAALRQLLNVIDPSCAWTGRNVPALYCQGDHTIPWRHGGETRVLNGKPLCQKHNRLKENGYRTWRDPNGQWHIQGPDAPKSNPPPKHRRAPRRGVGEISCGKPQRYYLLRHRDAFARSAYLAGSRLHDRLVLCERSVRLEGPRQPCSRQRSVESSGPARAFRTRDRRLGAGEDASGSAGDPARFTRSGVAASNARDF